MNLADMLSYADIQDLSRIAHTYNCECNGHSKNELIQSILTTVNRKEVFERQVTDMPIEDVRFLNSLIFDPRGSFSLEELIARVQQSRFIKEEDEEWNPRDMILRFKQRGWLFNGYSQQTRYLFQVPADLKRRFGDALTKQFQRRLVAAKEPEVYRDEQKLIVDDIAHFLQYVHQNEAVLTADNTMYKRQLLQVLDRLSVKEEPAPKTAWRFGYGRMFKDYPNRFSFIYDYCYYTELITEHHQVLALSDKGRERVTHATKEDLVQVYRFWLRLYKNAIPNLQSLVHWLDKIAKSWVTLESVKETLVPLIRPFYYDTPESVLEQRIVRMMMHLGLLRIGESDEFGTVVQVTKLGNGVIQGSYVADEDKITIPFENRSGEA
ncbi:hypothetical protein N0M98_20415 [Paenibacillus doosanensis]|uniref:Rho termination factor N-terminal domain-containing protein n=1 Tax=Paenibacillus konkukensis TaxID=2020716 RepID=A0ABY4RJV4_9BACL|nr:MULTISPECIES: hypothetical protein [Paenibacillus]MCS7462489.1 hypothetical protein [Paenibacillus doosanensis]UQZ81904.1 hypothetical protein SK3146_01060 [Paenibacillus konkukensis]